MAESTTVAPDLPLLTVVVPTFDRADVVERAVASVHGQDFAAVEVLVVDDGSNDDTIERLFALTDRRLRLLVA